MLNILRSLFLLDKELQVKWTFYRLWDHLQSNLLWFIPRLHLSFAKQNEQQVADQIESCRDKEYRSPIGQHVLSQQKRTEKLIIIIPKKEKFHQRITAQISYRFRLILHIQNGSGHQRRTYRRNICNAICDCHQSPGEIRRQINVIDQEADICACRDSHRNCKQ